jgi:hypothetical protein
MFAYCDELDADRVTVFVAPAAAHLSDAVVAWKVSGEEGLNPGTPIAFGEAPSGFRVDVAPSDVDWKQSSIQVSFIDTVGGGSAAGTFSGASLVEGKWLDWNGRLVDSPCSANG